MIEDSADAFPWLWTRDVQSKPVSNCRTKTVQPKIKHKEHLNEGDTSSLLHLSDSFLCVRIKLNKKEISTCVELLDYWKTRGSRYLGRRPDTA